MKMPNLSLAEVDMKMNRIRVLLVAGAALVFLPASLSAQTFSGSLPNHRAFLSSPRAMEEHPEILRIPLVARGESSKERLAQLSANRALAASPRFREAHPELLRPQLPAEKLAAGAAERRERLAELTENTALAASPRFGEEHPEVLRKAHTFEIAPLK